MHTNVVYSLLLSVLVVVAACDERESELNVDAAWGELSKPERISHLEAEYKAARNGMSGAADLAAWDHAYQDAKGLLSLLRAELVPDRREDYLEREAEFEAFAHRTHDSL